MQCVQSTIFFVLVGLVYSLHDQPSGEAVELTENGRFNDFILNELKQLKTFQKYAEKKISDLEQQNDEKDFKIEALEREISLLNKVSEQDVTVTRLREGRAVNRNVAFTAYITHPVNGITQSQPIKFDRVLLNDGNVYDRTTGEFTAPVSGVYFFSFSVGAKHISTTSLAQYDVFTRLVVNGVHQLSAVSESSGVNIDDQGSSTAIIYALEGDKIWVMMENKGGNSLYASNDERVTSFTGYLLYESGTPSGLVG